MIAFKIKKKKNAKNNLQQGRYQGINLSSVPKTKGSPEIITKLDWACRNKTKTLNKM